jgi:toxin ParE1/3/4
VRVLLRRTALRDLEDIFAYIAERNPEAARRTLRRIRRRIDDIAQVDFPSMGRRGPLAGTRVIVEHPYLITYYPDRSRDALVVLSIRHGKRRA